VNSFEQPPASLEKAMAPAATTGWTMPATASGAATKL
jgi:hypothetical protein